MANKQKAETQDLNLNKVLYGLIFLAFLLLAVFVFVFYSLNNLGNKIDSTNNNLSNKIDSLNKSLELESEDHFIDIQNNIKRSVVSVLSSPVHNDSGSNNVIYLDNSGQAWNLGTGFSIDSNGNILTAYHIVRDTNTVLIQIENRVIPVPQWRSFPDLDLAILYVNSSIPPVKFQNNLSYIGASIAFTGFPLSTSINGQNIPIETTVKGSVSALIPFTYGNQLVPVYVLGASANKGNSGGPVYSLKTGEVIGIINQKITDKEGIAISTATNQMLINNLMSVK